MVPELERGSGCGGVDRRGEVLRRRAQAGHPAAERASVEDRTAGRREQEDSA
jgi:hypothetical protein